MVGRFLNLAKRTARCFLGKENSAVQSAAFLTVVSRYRARRTRANAGGQRQSRRLDYDATGVVSHSLPRLGTLTMRLSIGNAPATVRAISSACRRKPPLQLMPSSATFSSVTDTETPSGAIERLLYSVNAHLIRTSMTLSASAERIAARSGKRRLSASSTMVFTQVS